MTPSLSEERNWRQEGPAPRVIVVKGQSILLRTWWTVCFFPNWSF